MIEVNVLKNQLVVTDREQITSGSVNVYYVHFHFSSHWDGLEKVAVFQTPTTTINVPIEKDVCVVPWEVTTTPGMTLRMGVYGIKTLEVILPTIWTNLGTVVEGVIIGDAESGDHTPDIYDAILGKIQDLSDEISNLKDDVNELRDDVPSDEEIFMIVDRYLKENPQDIDSAMIEAAVNNYFSKNPIETITPEQVNILIEQYLTNNQIGVTEERVQQMIDDSVGAAIADSY